MKGNEEKLSLFFILRTRKKKSSTNRVQNIVNI